ncbi:MAG: Maf family nucleotide pyrophosphatase [Micrococcales bacterium]|nr:Maf family nucleotide pyrophosphatase [Micrococcales bacterium]
MTEPHPPANTPELSHDGGPSPLERASAWARGDAGESAGGRGHREAQVELILASASPARLATLHAAGIRAKVLVSSVDEDAALARAMEAAPGMGAAEQVLVLARAKAEDVARRVGGADAGAGTAGTAGTAGRVLVLGCDSMLDLDGEVVGKPRDDEEARRRIQKRSGRKAVLHTGHWLVDLDEAGDEGEDALSPGPWDSPIVGEGRGVGATSSCTVHFGELSDGEIDAYVATGEPLAVAGAFTIDGFGGPFIRGVEGDHHGVVGLSLPLLRVLLAQVGVAIPALW